MTLSRTVGQAVRRFADAQTDRLAEVPSVRAVNMDVAAVSGADVDVTWRGGTYRVARVLPSYTPAPGDRVLVLVVDDQLIVVG